MPVRDTEVEIRQLGSLANDLVINLIIAVRNFAMMLSEQADYCIRHERRMPVRGDSPSPENSGLRKF